MCRQDMGRKIMNQFEDYVARDNIELMRAHLEASSYVSGSFADKDAER